MWTDKTSSKANLTNVSDRFAGGERALALLGYASDGRYKLTSVETLVASI